MDNIFYSVPNRGTSIEVHIADIHFGAIDPNAQLDILRRQFFVSIDQIPFNAVYINGDLFDHKVMANSAVVKCAMIFITELVNICKSHNATLVILAGTASHDAGQLSLFYHLQKDPYSDVRIVENTRFEYVNHKKVLCIPEEYDKGYDYYHQFLDQPYDMAILHGVFAGSIYGAAVPNLDISRPIFGIRDFDYCGGPIICGHVHKPGCFAKDVYYSGSPIRFAFGEEEEKGFIILAHNIDTGEYYTGFQPIYSFRYDTINLDDMIDGDPRLIIDYISNLQSQGIDYIRVEFTKNNVNNLTLLKNYYRNNKNVKVKDDSMAEVRQQKIQEQNDKFEEYSYLFDNSLTEYDKLTQYINQQKGFAFITSEDLKKLLSEV
jgi:DNA repair exonuclease SbcCD nuclease subunit